ncbi:hypothetical protein AAG906_015443 [Vitis piasezkii]
MYRDGMWAMFRKEGSDHAGLTWMIEALSRLVSGLPMWVESIRRGEFFTSGKGTKTGRGGAASPLKRGGAVAPLRKRGQLGEKGRLGQLLERRSACSIFLRSSGCKEGISRKGEYPEVMVGLRLAKEVIKVQQGCGYSRSSANSAADWPCLLLELLSQAAKIAYLDFRFPNIFISRETFGWTPQDLWMAKLHMVTDYFSHSELAVVADVLGLNPRHLFELYALKQSNYYQKVMEDGGSTFEEIIDAYLSYLQITVVDPAMDKALKLLEKFVYTSSTYRQPYFVLRWTKLQLIDFVQSLVYPSLGSANMF